MVVTRAIAARGSMFAQHPPHLAHHLVERPGGLQQQHLSACFA
jgi:hypothetical protein